MDGHVITKKIIRNTFRRKEYTKKPEDEVAR